MSAKSSPRSKAQSPLHILIAGALVVAGYANLICYDLFALHTIGKHKIPLRVVAFASFTSYTIGHSLGAATLTCGLVRFRVYSFWDLTVVDIAKIAFMTGMTFWLGNVFVLGGAVAYAPAAFSVVDHLPPWINRLIGLSGLFAIGCYLIWLTPRPRIVGRAELADRPARSAAHVFADRHRHARPLPGVAVDLHAAAEQPHRRLRDDRRRLRPRHAARRGQPYAGQSRRGRSRDTHRPAAISARGIARDTC